MEIVQTFWAKKKHNNNETLTKLNILVKSKYPTHHPPRTKNTLYEINILC